MKTLSILTSLFLCSFLSAQDITNTLGTGGNFVVRDAVNTYFTLQQSTGFLGLGPNLTTPRAQLEVGGYNGILATGTFGSGTALNLGAGARMHWYPRKAAFRAGVAETTYWDDTRIGDYSIAMGYWPRATANYSVAIGANARATGTNSMAFGPFAMATGDGSIAIGTGGWGNAVASGPYSIAIGTGCNTDGQEGAVVIGDNTYFQTAYGNANGLTMRFTGGYRLWTDYPDSSAGVYMRHGSSAWSSYSSKYVKENFKELDGEEVLQKLHDMPVTEWNYNGVDTVKYIGPMAQDFYAAFHLGGTDSLGINTMCIDGVNMAGVRALEKRTREMRAGMMTYEKRTEEQKSEIASIKSENEQLKKQLAHLPDIQKQFEELQHLKEELLEQLEILKNKNENTKETAALNFDH